MVQALVWIRQLLVRREGQGLVEYSLMVSLIAIAAMTAVGVLGSVVDQLYWRICSAVAQGQCS